MNLGFVTRMAWRDSRSSRRRLLLFSISISLGIAALVAIGLFRSSLAQAIDDQARSLLGADLVVESSRPFTSEQEQMLRSLGQTQAREVRFRTMALFPKGGGTRLVHVRALGGDFPFYGQMETAPASAARTFRNGGAAVPDESLLLQFHARAGDPIKIGEETFTVAGALTKMPGEASPAASFAPRVYIPLQNLAQTNLLKPGSLARYLNFVKFAPGTDVDREVQKVVPQIEKAGLEYDTVAKRKKDLGEALDNLYRFLNLVGFIALLLGAVGVASAIQAHLQQKVRTAAVLRCLGAAGRTTVTVYLLQAIALGVIGAVAGAAHRPDDSPVTPGHAAKIFAVHAPHGDRLAAGLPRDGAWARGLRSFRAPAAAALSARLAAAHFARGGGWKCRGRETGSSRFGSFTSRLRSD